MSMQLGLQLFSARNAFVENRSETLKKIAEIGYKHIEVPVDFSGKDLFGTGELKAADLKEMAEAVGLNILATHVLMTEESQFEKVIAFNQSIQCKNVVIPIAFFKNYEDVISFSETLNRYGKELHANGSVPSSGVKSISTA
jgi:sugar phosphate isomerase/epimerase